MFHFMKVLIYRKGQQKMIAMLFYIQDKINHTGLYTIYIAVNFSTCVNSKPHRDDLVFVDSQYISHKQILPLSCTETETEQTESDHTDRIIHSFNLLKFHICNATMHTSTMTLPFVFLCSNVLLGFILKRQRSVIQM